MDNVYVIQLIYPTERRSFITGVFAAQGLADMARDKLEAALSEHERDCGLYYQISAYELGKIPKCNWE
jgi:hypothetical protein